MNYKIRKVLIISALLIGTLVTSAFTFENLNPNEVNNVNEIVPYWNNAEEVSLDLTFNGGKANCYLYVRGKSNTTKVVADLQLYRINSNGSYTSVASWKNITSYGNSLNVTRSASVTSGYTYRLEANIKVHNGSNIESIYDYKLGYY